MVNEAIFENNSGWVSPKIKTLSPPIDSPTRILFLGLPILDSIKGKLATKSSNKPLSASEFLGVSNHSEP